MCRHSYSRCGVLSSHRVEYSPVGQRPNDAALLGDVLLWRTVVYDTDTPSKHGIRTRLSIDLHNMHYNIHSPSFCNSGSFPEIPHNNFPTFDEWQAGWSRSRALCVFDNNSTTALPMFLFSLKETWTEKATVECTENQKNIEKKSRRKKSFTIKPESVMSQ